MSDGSAGPTIIRHGGSGPLHVICLPGLVPDGPETFMRQRGILARRGTSAIFTYPYLRFDLDLVLDAIGKEIALARHAGRIPVLLAVSVGGGLALELLRRYQDQGFDPGLGAIALISPLSHLNDLSSTLSRLVKPIMEEHARAGSPEKALERGRAFFKGLASRSLDAGPAPVPWLGPFAVLTPKGYGHARDRAVKARIERTLERISSEGGVERVLAITKLRGLPERGELSKAPTMILWGSKERHTLNMDGPGTSRLCRPDSAYRVFPDVEVQWVYDHDGGEVPHGSAIRHAAAFNRHLTRFLGRVVRVRTPGVIATMTGLLPRRAAGIL